MFGLTTTRRLNAELAAAHAETNRQRERAERAEADRDTAEYNRSQVLRGNTVLDTANRDLFDRNLDLGRRLAALAEADPEYTAQLEYRLRRALGACARWMDATWAEARRADRLQQRLDQAVGLDSPAIELAGARARHDRLNAPKEADQ